MWRWPSVTPELERSSARWLLPLVLLEVMTFAALHPSFLTTGNAAELVRLGVEVGLLAVALTPIVITGGIDLSVGSMLGLTAVVFGLLWRDAGIGLVPAFLAAIVVGGAGGLANAWLITRLRVPPLVATLGTLSLYRGLAEGLTQGADSVTGFPAAFLQWGQGFWAGLVPWQALPFAAVALGTHFLLRHTIAGRTVYAIGLCEAGARYAAVPVARRLALLYGLSGVAAALAGIVYVAHVGQAKADAGTGYELLAVTAVVLGGTSIFGGRGSVPGTLIGLLAIVVMQNGMRLAGLPAELAGILTGALLLATMALEHHGARWARRLSAWHAEPTRETGEQEMRNSQLAVLSAVVLAGSVLVAASNWYLVRSLRQELSAGRVATPAEKKLVVGMMPKAKGDPYFVSCRLGAEEAARELNVELLWDGPTQLDSAKQNEVVEGWITRGVDVIAAAVENQAALSTVLRKARQRGIKVITWDADAQPDARDFLVNQATPQGIGYVLADEASRVLKGQGSMAIVTGALGAANQNEWLKHIRARLADKHPQVKLAVVRPCDDDRDRAFAETQTILRAYPDVRAIVGISAPAVPGSAEAVRQSGREDVRVLGLSLPNLCKPYIHAGVVESVVLWNTRDLGYLTVLAADALGKGTLKAGADALSAGRLGTIQVRGSEILLGAPFVFTKANIDRFDF